MASTLTKARKQSQKNPSRSRLKKSEALWNQSRTLIPCGTQTLSKGPNMHAEGIYPKYLEKGRGAHVWDVDGNEYIDYPMALGPILLGYAYPATVKTVTHQMRQGTSFSLMHPLEVEVAELMKACIPCAEMTRFSKTGSEAASAAVRLARAFTGKDMILHCGYHGWHDWHIVNTAYDAGIPSVLKNYIRNFEYNHLDSLERLFKEYRGKVAAVIMEPVGVIEPKPDFLKSVKKMAHDNGALLIYDEIITGFRWSLGGAQEYFGVIPDLACFGKAMANGVPISAVCGKSEVMKTCEKIFFSTTFGGDCLGLAAAKSTIQEIKNRQVIAHIWDLGHRLKEGINRLARDIGVFVECVGMAPHTVLTYKDREGKHSNLIKTFVLQETVRRGIILGSGMFICYRHTRRDLEKTLQACEETFVILKKYQDQNILAEKVEGPLVRDVFRRA